MRWPSNIPTSLCTLNIKGTQGRDHAAAALAYLMCMPACRSTMHYESGVIYAYGGRKVVIGSSYHGFRRFEIARVEHNAKLLTEAMIECIETDAQEVCMLNFNSVNNSD